MWLCAGGGGVLVGVWGSRGEFVERGGVWCGDGSGGEGSGGEVERGGKGVGREVVPPLFHESTKHEKYQTPLKAARLSEEKKMGEDAHP